MVKVADKPNPKLPVYRPKQGIGDVRDEGEGWPPMAFNDHNQALTEAFRRALEVGEPIANPEPDDV